MPLTPADKALAAFKHFALLGFVTGFRQDDTLDTHLLASCSLSGEYTPRSALALLRWVMEEFLMRFEAGRPLLRVGRIAIQDAVVADIPPSTSSSQIL